MRNHKEFRPRTHEAASPRYACLEEVRDLIRQFELTTWPRDRWDHAAQLTVDAWYMLHHPEDVAAEKVISRIHRYNNAHDISTSPGSGYHETITLFWLCLTRAWLRDRRGETGQLELINGLVAEYEKRDRLFLDYYSRERIHSARAQLSYVEPDIQPLPR